MRSALLLALVLWALPAAAADDTWSDADVEAADRYRVAAGERAERARAQLEAPRGEAPAPRAHAPRSGEGLGDRVAGGVRGWLEGVLADLVRAGAGAPPPALRELLGALAPPHARARRLRRAARGAARPAAPPAPESVREWQQREAERARELAKREEAEAR